MPERAVTGRDVPTSPMAPPQDEAVPHPVLPFRHSMQSEKWYQSIDPGIRFAVRVLHAAGIDTGQSCEGGDGHSYDHPTVDLGGYGGHDAAGFSALHALIGYGLPVVSVGVEWAVVNGWPVDSFWRIVFREQMHDRADEQPMFVRHYRYNVALYDTEQGDQAGPSIPPTKAEP